MRDAPDKEARERGEWMSVLARAGEAELEQHLAGLCPGPEYEYLRRPETGLVMVRARAEGAGQRFNLGEMTMTRCAVKVGGRIGCGYVAGRCERRSELAALFDGLLQDEALRPGLLEKVIRPLAMNQAKARQAEQARAGATRVEFFTMTRGED